MNRKRIDGRYYTDIHGIERGRRDQEQTYRSIGKHCLPNFIRPPYTRIRFTSSDATLAFSYYPTLTARLCYDAAD